MLKNTDAVSFIATQDPEKSRAFYEGTLGLALVSEDYYALVFKLNGHMLRVTRVEELTPAKHTVLGWNVRDISAVVRGLKNLGVVFERFDAMEQDDLAIWLSPSGAKVVWFKDPDGNILSLTELPGGSAE